MGDERVRAVFIDGGRARGEALGDAVAEALVSFDRSQDLSPEMRDGAKFETIGSAYYDLRTVEQELIASGASEEDAASFRISASVAVMRRLRMADLMPAASTNVN